MSTKNLPALYTSAEQHIKQMLLALNLGKGSITPTPTIIMHVATCHRQVNIDILPDWGGGGGGGNMCDAGTQFVEALGNKWITLHTLMLPTVPSMVPPYTLSDKSLMSCFLLMARVSLRMCTSMTL